MSGGTRKFVESNGSVVSVSVSLFCYQFDFYFILPSPVHFSPPVKYYIS